jgi:flagellar motor component MotA
MRVFMGLVIASVGVVLLIQGLDAVDTLGSRISRAFDGTTTDRTTWYFLGGALAVLVGLAMALSGGNRRGLKTR